MAVGVPGKCKRAATTANEKGSPAMTPEDPKTRETVEISSA